MAANARPIFPAIPRMSGGKVIAADTNDMTPATNPVTLSTAGESGARINTDYADHPSIPHLPAGRSIVGAVGTTAASSRIAAGWRGDC